MVRLKATLSDKQTWQVVALAVLLTLALQSGADARTRDELFGHASEDFWKSLDNRVSLLRQNVPLRDAVRRFGEANRLNIFVDRRLDPHANVDMIANHATVREVLEGFAAANGWSVSYLPPVIYLGPRETTAELATTVYRQQQLAQRLPARRRRALRSELPLSWARLTEPRKLVSRWADRFRLEITGTEQIPHDLWDSVQLPKTDILSALTIVLAGFDLGVQVESTGEIVIVPLPKNQSIRRNYRLSDARRRELSSSPSPVHAINVSVRGNLAIVDGSLEQHRELFDWLSHDGVQRPKNGSTRKRFTLAVQNEPFEVVLTSVVKQLGMELVWRLKDPTIRQQRISVSVKDATMGELLSAICDAVDAEYVRRLNRIVVTQAEAKD